MTQHWQIIKYQNQQQMIEGSPSLLIRAIGDQTSQIPFDMVYVIDIVSVRFGGYFTPEIRMELQKFRNLQMLTLNDCGISSLQNFPFLPNLIRLDMVFNEIKGSDLTFLKSSRHIQTLMLGANKIQTLEELAELKFMTNLMQLDLINNPVFKQPGYRIKVYQIFPSLIILDTLDKSGKDAYNNVTMMETIHRIPEHLFNQGEDNIQFNFVHHEQKKNLRRALSRAGSLESINVRPMERKKMRKSQKIKKEKTNSYGNIFPINKIRRLLKQKNISGMKISKSSAVCLSAILQYITAQFLDQVGEQTKNQRKSRISPLIMKDCLQYDTEINKLWKCATLGTMGQ